MAKAKPLFNTGGYSDWSIRRTLREAENAARWSPWCAVKWMEEARNRISIQDPFFDEYDKSAKRSMHFGVLTTNTSGMTQKLFGDRVTFLTLLKILSC